MYQNVSYWLQLLALTLISGSKRLKQRVQLLTCGSSFDATTITARLPTVPSNTSRTSSSGFVTLGGR
jgi:hypothetical protein